MKKILLPLLLASLIALTSCWGKTVVLQSPSDKNIDVYISKSPDRDYTEEYFFQVNGNFHDSYQVMLEKLKDKAREMKCDAVSNVSFQRQSVNLYFFSLPFSRIEATGIKYKK